MIYDTLKLSKALRVSFTPEQSDTLARAFSDSTEDNVATKRDIAELKSEIAELRAGLKGEIAHLKTEIGEVRTGLRGEIAEFRAELKGEIVELRAELKGEIVELRAELETQIAAVRNEIASLKVDMVRWIVGAIAFNLLGTIGIMVTVAELVSKAK